MGLYCSYKLRFTAGLIFSFFWSTHIIEPGTSSGLLFISTWWWPWFCRWANDCQSPGSKVSLITSISNHLFSCQATNIKTSSHPHRDTTRTTLVTQIICLWLVVLGKYSTSLGTLAFCNKRYDDRFINAVLQCQYFSAGMTGLSIVC